MSTPSIILHSTPPLGPLPASDAESLYLAALLQLAAPGYCAITRGEWGSNGGKLPFVTHLGHKVPFVHLSSLPGFGDPDDVLSPEEKTDALCWKSFIEDKLVDLVNHTFYSLPPNYPSTIAKAQFEGLTFPQNQYIPQRLRSTVKSRLEFVGLWGLGGLNYGDAVDQDRKRSEETVITGPGGTTAPRAWSGWKAGQDMEKSRRLWGEQQLEERYKAVLDPIAIRLANKTYFYKNQPTTLDLALFAQLTFILSPYLPNPLFPQYIRTHYPSLIAHHDRLAAHFSHSSPIPIIVPTMPTQLSWTEIISSWIPRTQHKSTEKKEEPKKELKSSKDIKMERGRWLWFAAASVSMVTYLLASGIISLDFGGEEEEEEEEWEVVLDDGGDEEILVVVEENGE